MQLSEIVPWGRSYEEYAAMFALSSADSRRRIIGCADGPASFNAELTASGGHVVSVDPVYEFTGPVIQERFELTAPTIIAQLRENLSAWVWTRHSSPDDLLQSRRHALERFLADYEAGRATGRYRAASLPALPFADGSFDLALCSHFLFLYSAMLTEQFHVLSVLELCRIAREVRIFPLLTLAQERSPHIGAVCDAVAARGWLTQTVRVPYEFQRGGNEMLVIRCV
jgi:hypothetical protein